MHCTSNLAVLILAMAAPAIAGATNFTWNAGPGLWSTTTFWLPNAPVGGPPVNDNVFVTDPFENEFITINANAGALRWHRLGSYEILAWGQPSGFRRL